MLVRCGLLGSCSASINASGADGLRLSGDCPDKACQFARNRGGDHGRWLSCPRQLAIPPAQSFLCLPRGIADRFGQTVLPQQLLAANPRREPIAPGSLDEHSSCRTVASLGDTALAPCPSAGVLGRHQAQIRHELVWIGEARDVANTPKLMCSSSIACSKARHRSRSLIHIAWPQRPKGIQGLCKLSLVRWQTPMRNAMHETP